MTDGVGEIAVSHNFSALDSAAAFGMGNRMMLLLYPVAALLRGRKNPKVLIVGPRTEDDIFWARSLVMRDAIGFDLFTYSEHILLGDMHKTDFADNTFDAVISGWVLAYSADPQRMVDESKRIIKNGGFLAMGLAVYPPKAVEELGSTLNRANLTNSVAEICDLVKSELVFASDPEEPNDAHEIAAVFKIRK
jgi:SAM-dependent methyltransferase